MFRKQEREVTEGMLLRDTLRHKDTTITVQSPTGRRWTFCNDTAAECAVQIQSISVTESKDKRDILTRFAVRATNGRTG